MLRLYVDRARWDKHLHAVRDSHPGIVPVAKGNGYGFGTERLADEAGDLDVDVLAVGSYEEVARTAAFEGSVMVLTPWRPFEAQASYDGRVIHTVGRLGDLRDLSERGDRPRVVLERLSSMRRHGFTAGEMREVGEVVRSEARVVVEGVALHLPIGATSHVAEVDRLMTDVVAANLPSRVVYVSHLTDGELDQLRGSWADYDFRPRIGTALWLGDRQALSARATVLDIHPVERGDVSGYRGRPAPRPGFIVVVSGGTAHGIGLEAPGANLSVRDRAAGFARGGLDAVGVVRSPYTVAGKRRLFAEPPHMQVSLLFLPRGTRVPEVGEELDVRVRYTITTFDQIVFH
jgi:alanine racemase